MVKQIVEYNDSFVINDRNLCNTSSKNPKKEVVILTCMDARLLTFLPNALGISDGDVKMIRNAGSLIISEHDTTIRSLLIAIIEFNIHEVMIIGHSDCGVSRLTPEKAYKKLNSRGVLLESIEGYSENNADFHKWFKGFESDERAVLQSTQFLESHPLMPSDVRIYGYVIDTETGVLSSVN